MMDKKKKKTSSQMSPRIMMKNLIQYDHKWHKRAIVIDVTLTLIYQISSHNVMMIDDKIVIATRSYIASSVTANTFY